MLSDLLLWWAARQGLVRQAKPARRVALARLAVERRRRRGGRRLARALIVLADREIENGDSASAELHAREAIPADTVTAGDARRVLARALIALDRHEEAVEAARAAADLYRAVPMGRPMIGRLVAALHYESLALTELSRLEEALTVAEDGHRLAQRVGVVGWRHAVLTRAGGAMQVSRVRYQQDVHLVSLLSRLGRHAEAVALGDEVLWILDALARLYPRYYGPRRYQLLWFLAQSHRVLGHPQDAVAASEKTLEQARRLGSNQRGVAETLEVHAGFLAAAGRPAEADEARLEALEILASLGERTSRHRVAWARVDARWAAGDRTAANALAIEYLPTLRDLAATDPALRKHLAEALALTGARLAVAGQADGMAYADEGVAVARGCGDAVLAWCLRRRAMLRRDAGDAPGALGDAIEAADLLADGANDDERARSLAVAAEVEVSRGRHDAALRHRLAAVEVGRRLPERRLVDLLDSLALVYRALHRHADAIDVLGESIELRRRLESDVERDAGLATALRRRSHDLAAVRRHAEARADVTEAIAILERLVALDAARFDDALGWAREQAATRATGDDDEIRQANSRL